MAIIVIITLMPIGCCLLVVGFMLYLLICVMVYQFIGLLVMAYSYCSFVYWFAIFWFCGFVVYWFLGSWRTYGNPWQSPGPGQSVASRGNTKQLATNWLINILELFVYYFLLINITFC